IEDNNSGSLEHVNKNNSSWDEQVAQETKELKEITNIHKEELKENRTYITKENILLFIEDNTLNEEVLEISTCNKDNNKTTCDKEVSETSTANKDNIETTSQNDAGLQENDLTQEDQNGPLLSSMEIDNNKRNSSLSKDKDLSSDQVIAPYDELAALYLNAEPQAGNKNTDETLPIIE
ncbi:717_t:CDS:2, partial [Cetraspora pellucida]